jgi:hypothetical protein
MSVTVSQLKKSGIRGKELDAICREHIQIIDDKLLKADRTWGRNMITHDLPVTMVVSNLDKKDAQRIVYSTILHSLDKRGFTTQIRLDPDRTTIFVSWTTSLSSVELGTMNDIIRSKRINSSKPAKTQ